MPPNSLKYPRTPYWPLSPTIGRGDTVHADPERFVGHPVVVTEKLDGSNVLIHRGKRDAKGDFSSMAALERFADERNIPVVPVIFQGVFASLAEMRVFLEHEQAQRSVLGGEREGTVVRIAEGFASAEFARNVCKSVRRDHVQTDQHWTRNWRPCALRGD